MKPARADKGIKGLGFLVAILIVAWWVYIFHGRSSQTREGTDNVTPHVTIAPTNPDGPQVKFPDSAKSDNPEINNFVAEFVNVLLAGDYKNYRLKVTQRREPLGHKTFEDAYGRVKAIEILKIEKIEDRAALKDAKLGDVEPPVYRVRVNVVLRDGTELERELPIFKEQGNWVSAN